MSSEAETMSQPYDALLVVSFGGPEGPDDVMPFLENVLRGRNVPRERMLEVAEHYHHFGGVSPINAQNRELIQALQRLLDEQGPHLPIYWGNRNWHPRLTDTMYQMVQDGVHRALAFVTSAFSCYSGCRQYREDIQRSQAEIGPQAPQIDKLRMFFNHPGFVRTMADRVRDAINQIAQERQSATQLIFTAHSIPLGMADNCRYVEQLQDSCQLVSDQVGHGAWTLVYQSRSGPPSQPWLEPDVCDYLSQLSQQGVQDVVIVPIGFISDHMEVKYDLDTEAHDLCQKLGLNMVRAGTAGVHPEFVAMIRELILERLDDAVERRALGKLGPSHDVCPVDCCLWEPPKRRPS